MSFEGHQDASGERSPLSLAVAGRISPGITMRKVGMEHRVVCSLDDRILRRYTTIRIPVRCLFSHKVLQRVSVQRARFTDAGSPVRP
jgi:hypothetical protein